MELKPEMTVLKAQVKQAFNRTIMELKQQEVIDITVRK